MKRHIKDDFEFIVFNNERAGSNPFSGYKPERIQEINDVCESLGIQCIRVELDPEYQYINGYKQFEGDSFTGDGSQVCGYAFTWGWQHYIVKNDCISILIDSDMFFIKDISFEEMMKDYNLAFIPSYRYSQKYSEKSRGQIALRYPWNGLVIADIPNMPNPSELKWGLGIFNGQSCDVGGEGYQYLIDYEYQLKIKYLDHVSIQKLGELLRQPPKNINVRAIGTDATPAMPDECIVPGDSVASYRKYYIMKKVRFATWKAPSKMPDWFAEGVKCQSATIQENK